MGGHEYTRPRLSVPKGLNEKEVAEYFQLETEASMFGYTSLSDEKLHRLEELIAKMG